MLSRLTVPRILAPRARNMQILTLNALSDNYMYVLKDDKTGEAAAIDPFDASGLLRIARQNNIPSIKNLITTHHHYDHSGGNKEFVSHVPDAVVYGGSDLSPKVNRFLSDGDIIKLGSLNIRAIHTPAHTQDHFCFYVEDGGRKAVFTGDTLFVGGCGRLFEGTPEQMHESFEKLKALPHDTEVFVGHEYTGGNARFGLSVEPQNPALAKLAEFAKANKVTTGKFRIADELKHNVFMRTDVPSVLSAINAKNPKDAFAKLRQLKDSF